MCLSSALTSNDPGPCVSINFAGTKTIFWTGNIKKGLGQNFISDLDRDCDRDRDRYWYNSEDRDLER